MTFSLSLSIKQAIVNHARAALPKEACGVVINGKVMEVKNNHFSPLSNFAISAEDYAKLEEQGTIQAIYHSHPAGVDGFSQADVKACKQSNIPWVVFSCRTGNFFYADPTGSLPYEGRQWVYGVQDCYALLRDFYKREFNIALDDFPRGQEKEWEKPEWQMFDKHYASQGFVAVNEAGQKGDMLLMHVGAPSPNHVGVLSSDGTFYHHLMNRFSERNVYGGYWAKITTQVLRHQQLL
jgi:proteasome lid subunit RPN8/RPN11